MVEAILSEGCFHCFGGSVLRDFGSCRTCQRLVFVNFGAEVVFAVVWCSSNLAAFFLFWPGVFF